MSVCLKQGQSAGPEDLTQVVYRDGSPVDVYQIEYQIYDCTSGMPIAMTARAPATREEEGVYYAPYTVPLTANVGDWLVKWYITEVMGGAEFETLLKFGVVLETTQVASSFDVGTQELLRLLRVILRDNNPDRNYHFAPPTRERLVNQYTTVYGYLWEDQELVDHMTIAIYEANMRPPIGSFPSRLADYYNTSYCFIPLIGGAASAVRAMALNWVEEEFSYSIGGISLDISKAQSYMSMKENFESRFDTILEDYLKNGGAFVVKGLSQGYYGIGFTAALGPSLREGTISARNYVGRR